MNETTPACSDLPLAGSGGARREVVLGAIRAAGLCLAVLLGSSCDRGTGSNSEQASRTVVDGSGRPIAGARVSLVRLKDSTGTPVAVGATDSAGGIPLFQVPDGVYAAVLRDPSDSLGRFIDSLVVVGGAVPAGKDTLLPLGGVGGVVRVLAGDSPAIVSLWLAGTDILASAREDGTFEIDFVPPGKYILVAYATQGRYLLSRTPIELLPGQKLTLLDTLVVPFDGLSPVSSVQAWQDSITGMVGLSWSDLVPAGTLFEIQRSGSPWASASWYGTDTTFQDSLGTDYRSLPLLGPWPSGEILYQVTALPAAGSGSLASPPSGIRLLVQPPSWTRTLDSVRVHAAVDTGTGHATLDWSPYPHPDRVGWSVVRSVEGLSDCSSRTSLESWSDSACQDSRLAPVDTAGSDTLMRSRDAIVSWTVSGIRSHGGAESLGVASAAVTAPTWFGWDDTGILQDGKAYSFTAAGSWLLLTKQPWQYLVTLDGVEWEDLPVPTGAWSVEGDGDSLWLASMADDSSGVLLSSRSGPTEWNTRRIPLPQKDPSWRIDHLGTFGGKLVLWLDFGNDPAYPMVVDGNGLSPKCTSDSICQLSDWWRWVPNPVLQAQTAESPPISWHRGQSYPLGALGAGMLLTYSPPQANSGLVYQAGMDSFRLVPPPPGVSNWNALGAVSFLNQVWSIVDGHVWKGHIVRVPY
jgi:hypothetical protein